MNQIIVFIEMSSDTESKSTSSQVSDKFKSINIPESISSKIGKNLHNIDNHPIGIIKDLVYEYFDSLEKKNKTKFEKFSDIGPVVSTKDNFDSLLIPKYHPARSKSDTYYVDDEHVLRTHTSAHQCELLSKGHTSFLVTGDVYRKDEIDSTHYPVFHQMEGVHIDMNETMTKDELEENLVSTLIGLCNHLFPGSQVRVSEDYFPFTDPSFEMEVFHNGEWIEVLGCGVIQNKIIKNCSESNKTLVSKTSSDDVKNGWAFGIGLERLAMILFEIPDIRLIWVDSNKFLDQFKTKTITKFKPYSILQSVDRDVSFFIPQEQVLQFSNDEKEEIEKIKDVEKFTDKKTGIVRIWKNENDMFDVIRETSNKIHSDIVSVVIMFDQFYNQKLSKLSRTYRISYSPPDPDMSSPGEFALLVNKLHETIAKDIESSLGVTIR